MSATVPLYIVALSLYCRGATIYSRFKPVLPQCRQAYTRAYARTLFIYYIEKLLQQFFR